jgi:spore coat protein U-like protein
MRQRFKLAAVGVLVFSLTEGSPDPALAQFPRALPPRFLDSCTIETRPVSFGEYDAFEPRPRDAQGAAIYDCTQNRFGSLRVRIELSKGQSNSWHRELSNDSETLGYNLYLDATRQTVWGDGSGGTQFYSITDPPDDRPITVPIYGRIPPSQSVGVGVYSDVIEVKIQF